LANSSWAIEVSTGSINVNSGGGVYYHNSTQGQSVSGIFSGGIFISTGSVSLIEFQNLAPTDKVLVIN
jgi:hypothetical protein